MLLIPISRTDNMVGYHLPGDPYNPHQGNGGQIEEDSDKESMEDSDLSGTGSEPQVCNPPQGVQRPSKHHFQGPTPVWGEEL